MAQPQMTSREYIEYLRSQRAAARAGAPLAQPTPVTPPTPTQSVTEPAYQAPIASPSPEIPVYDTPVYETPSYQPLPPAQTPAEANTPTQAPATAQTEPANPQEDISDDFAAGPEPEILVYEWQALSRPFKKRDRQFFTVVTAIVFLISLILILAQQFLPVAVVIAGGFLYYVISSVHPEMITHRITTYGIRIEDQMYFWEELGRFWYTTRLGHRLVHIELGRFPGRLTFLLGDTPEDGMTELLSVMLYNQQPEPTIVDKATEWLQKALPLDQDSAR